MPGATDPYKLPYPLPGDPPSGAEQMRALAEATDDAIKAVDDVTKANAAAIVDIRSKIPTAKAKWGAFTGTPNASGRLTIPHAAGWVPVVIVLTAGVTTSVTRGVGVTYDKDTITSTALVAMLWNLDTGAPWTGSVTVSYILRD
jgi:hypothetical protein